MRRAILSIAILLLITSSMAQVPPSPVQPVVSLSIEAIDDGASIDAPATYTVTISNDSPGSGSGTDQPMNVEVRVTSDTAGWTASLDQTSFQIIAGETDQTTLTVTVTGNAQRDAAIVTVDATIRNGAPPLEQTGTDSESVEVLRDESARRAVTETIGDFLWYIVGGGVLVYIVSMALMAALFRKRGQGGNGDGEA